MWSITKSEVLRRALRPRAAALLVRALLAVAKQRHGVARGAHAARGAGRAGRLRGGGGAAPPQPVGHAVPGAGPPEALGLGGAGGRRAAAHGPPAPGAGPLDGGLGRLGAGGAGAAGRQRRPGARRGHGALPKGGARGGDGAVGQGADGHAAPGALGAVVQRAERLDAAVRAPERGAGAEEGRPQARETQMAM